MKRWMRVAGLSLVALVAVCGLLWPVSAAADDKNNFEISSYDIELHLSKDADGRSTLKTIETITATFPNFDQNHGIERFVPREYDGHSTSLSVTSVTDQNGTSRNFTTYTSGDYEVIRIGDADRYVHGEQTYRLTYTQRDVTKAYSDTNRDEFYWDANGTEWRVPIRSLTVQLTIDESLQADITEDYACYQGAKDTTDRCDIERSGNVYRAQALNLGRGDNVTLSVGFRPGTFMPYQQSLIMTLFVSWFILQFFLTFVAVGLIIFLSIRFSHWSHRRDELGTIIPEYIPPKDASVQTASTIITPRSTFAAQLIDLAVRHYLKIYETKAKSFWSKAVYEIEIARPVDNLRAEEQEFLTDVFAGSTAVGSKVNTQHLSKDYSLATRMSDNPKKLKTLMRGDYGLQQKDAAKSKWFKKFGLVMLFTSFVLLSPILFIVAIVSLVMSATLWVLTDKGLELYRYLEGLKLYISVAEQERLKVLQSPEGAVKTPVDINDPKQLVELYEKLLPYAMLFGQEKEWNKQLGNYYESTGAQPTWYHGTNMAAFSAASFSSTMSNLTSSISSNGAASSSSGGSTGGGSSGGGGGGGGGGGW